WPHAFSADGVCSDSMGVHVPCTVAKPEHSELVHKSYVFTEREHHAKMNTMAALTEARKRERTLLDDALNALAHTTGLHGTVTAREPRLTNGVRADALIEIRVDGKRVPLFAEVKAVDRVVGLATVKNQ